MTDKCSFLPELFGSVSRALLSGLSGVEARAALKRVERDDISQYEQDGICRDIATIHWLVRTKAEALPETERSPDGNIVRLPPNSLQREITALYNLAQALNFSEDFTSWVDERLTALARRVARLRTPELERHWPNMDLNGRLAFLNAVNVIQADLFSNDALPFLPMNPTARNLGRTVRGAFNYKTDPLDDAHLIPTMFIDTKHLATADCLDAIGTAVHEGLHSMLRQMGYRYKGGLIKSGDRFAGEARLMSHILHHGAYIPEYCREAYRANVEERVAWKHVTFEALLMDQAVRRGDMVTRIKPRPE